MISAFTDEQKTQESILSKVTFPFQELSVLASYIPCCRASLVAQRVKNACNAGDQGLNPGSGKSPGKRNG